jgi:hypothetical protein
MEGFSECYEEENSEAGCGNKLPDADAEEFTHEEFKVIAEHLLEVHARYPERHCSPKLI